VVSRCAGAKARLRKRVVDDVSGVLVTLVGGGPVIIGIGGTMVFVRPEKNK